MGFRNQVFRTLLLRALARGVGIAVGISSGGERTHPAHGSLPALEHPMDQHVG